MENFSIKPNIILVGKPNVGKSTLFNRFSKIKISIAHETRGATRDFIMREADFLGQEVIVVDSGGLYNEDPSNPFNDLVTARVAEFIKEKSNLVLFLVSAKDAITPQDEAIARMLRKTNKPVILVINKVDDEKNLSNASDCFNFGFSDVITISAAQNQGLSLLKEVVLKKLGLNPSTSLQLISDEGDDLRLVKIAVVGRPNSGKSTFVNAVLNEDRVMTSDIPGTTLDAIDTKLEYGGKEIILIDTAGIRRQRGIYEEIEKMAIARSLCALDRADVGVLMLCAKEGVTEQDKKIAGMIFDKKKACIIAVNKWDEEVLQERKKADFIEEIKFHIPFLAFAPIIFLSAKYKKDVFDILELALKLTPRFKSKINTSKLNRAIEKAQEAHPAPVENGKRIKFFFATQIGTAPPTFAITCNMPDKVHFSYERYLSNFLRRDLQLDEIPIRIVFRKKSRHDEDVI